MSWYVQSAINAENKMMNSVKNQITGQYGPVPDTARFYKVMVFIVAMREVYMCDTLTP